MKHFEKTLDTRDIFRGRVLHVTLDTVELEDGKTSRREIVRHPGGAAVLPLHRDGTVTLVRQFRYAYAKEILEIPAGKLEPGEDPQAAALRELEEECGLTAGAVTSLGCIYPSVGYVDEVIYLYLATDLRETESRPDEGEFVSLERMPLEELVEQAMNNQLHDAKTVVAALKARLLQG